MREKPSSVKGKITGQIWSIYYNKIEIITLKLYPKPEFTINWKNTIITLGTNTTSPQNLIARSSTLNTSTLCNCSTQIMVLKKTPIYLLCMFWAKEKSPFSFFYLWHTEYCPFSGNLCFTLHSLSKFLSMSKTHVLNILLYI